MAELRTRTGIQDRVRGRSQVGPQAVRPQTAPVGTFAPQRRDGLERLAGALSEFEPTMARFAGQQLQARAQDQTEEGRQEAMRLINEERMSYQEAVEEGLIRQDQDPWFRLGMERQFSEVSANNYGLALRKEAQKWLDDPSVMRDPSVFQDREAQFRTEWARENLGEDVRTPEFDNMFAQRVNQMAYGIGTQFAQAAGDQAVQASVEMVYSQAQGELRTLDSEDENVSVEEIGRRLTALQQSLITDQNLDARQVNHKIIDAIHDYAVEERDSSVLDLIEATEGLQGGSGFLGATEYATAVRNDAREKIRQGIKADNDWNTYQRQQRGVETYRTFIQDVVLNPEVELTQEVANEWASRAERFNPEVASAIRAMPAQRAREQIANQPEVVNRLGQKIVQNRWSLEKVLQETVGLSFQDQMTLMNAAVTVDSYQARTSGANASTDLIGSPLWNQKSSWLRRVSGAETTGPMARFINPRLQEVRWEDALSVVENQYMEWVVTTEPEERTMTPQQKLDELFNTVREVYFPLDEFNSSQRRSSDNLLESYESDRDMLSFEPEEIRQLRGIQDAMRRGQSVVAQNRKNELDAQTMGRIRLQGYDTTDPNDWIALFESLPSPN